MAVQDRPKLYSAEDLAAMPEGDMKRELVRGEIIEMSPSGRSHGKLSFHLAELFILRSKARETGEITIEGPGYILSRDPDTVRASDLGYISKERLKGVSNEGYYSAAPDLAIEIASPNDKGLEIREKVQEYLQAGTQLVVVIYPKLRLIDMYTSSGATTVYSDGALDFGPVLPDFTLQVKDIFAVLEEA